MESAEIKLLRQALHLKQIELGQVVNAHAATVARWETGALRPSAYQAGLLSLLAEALPEMTTQRKEVRVILVQQGVLGVLRLAFELTRRPTPCAECGAPAAATTAQRLPLCGEHLVAVVSNGAWRAAHLRSVR